MKSEKVSRKRYRNLFVVGLVSLKHCLLTECDSRVVLHAMLVLEFRDERSTICILPVEEFATLKVGHI